MLSSCDLDSHNPLCDLVGIPAVFPTATSVQVSAKLRNRLVHFLALLVVFCLSGGAAVATPSLLRAAEATELEGDGSLIEATQIRRQSLRTSRTARRQKAETVKNRPEQRIRPEGRYWLVAEQGAFCKGFDSPTPSRDPPSLL